MNDYFPRPKTAEQFVSNVQFQLENVQGYLGVKSPQLREQARIKAKCLREAAQALEAHLEAEAREGAL